MLKCARCRRVFPAPGQATAPRRPKRPAEDDNMSFSFDDDDEWRAPELTSDDVPEDAFLLNAPADPAPPPAPRPRRPRGARPVPGQESLRFDDEDDEEMPEADDADGEADDGLDPEPAFTMGAEPPAQAVATRREASACDRCSCSWRWWCVGTAP